MEVAVCIEIRRVEYDIIRARCETHFAQHNVYGMVWYGMYGSMENIKMEWIIKIY